LSLDPPPCLNRRIVVAERELEIPSQNIGPDAQPMMRERLFEIRTCGLRARIHDLVSRRFAVKIGNLFLVRLAGYDLELLCDVDRFGPIFLELINLEQMFKRCLVVRGVAQLCE
jgi:hypothetical protein